MVTEAAKFPEGIKQTILKGVRETLNVRNERKNKSSNIKN
jgi:hypothetical protein